MSFVRTIKVFLFICSILSGALFAIVWRHYELAVRRIANIHSPHDLDLATSNDDRVRRLDDRMRSSPSYADWLRQTYGYVAEPIPREVSSYAPYRSSLQTEAKFLHDRIKVSCIVLAGSRRHARALAGTWTRRCNDVTFFAGFTDSKNPRLTKIEILDENLYSPRTFCRAFVHRLRSGPDFHWLMITTDRTFAIVENLRHYVAPVNATEPFYIGRPVHHYFLGIYNAYDSGIVLSQGAAMLLAESAFRDDQSCIDLDKAGGGGSNRRIYSGNFDAFIGMQLAKHSVRAIDSLDHSTTGTRFHPFMPEKHIVPESISLFDTYWSSNVLPIKAGFWCCSDKAITFTGFSSVTMYFIDYLLYHLAAFTEFDGPHRIGNHPSPETYRVSSDFDHKFRSKKSKRKKSKHHAIKHVRQAKNTELPLSL